MKRFIMLAALTAILLAGDKALAAPKPSAQSIVQSHFGNSNNSHHRAPVHTNIYNQPTVQKVTTFKQINGPTFPVNYTNRGFTYYNPNNFFYRPTHHHHNHWHWYHNWHTNFGNYLPTWFFGGYWDYYYPSWYGSAAPFGNLYR